MPKGRSIGLIEPAEEKEDSQKKRQEQSDGTRVVKIMVFSLRVKGDAVVPGSKLNPLKEESLKNKYGDKGSATGRAAFEDSLLRWKGSLLGGRVMKMS